MRTRFGGELLTNSGVCRRAAAECCACDLWNLWTQTVFGQGPKRAKVLFVGEQPRNEEDLSGRSFVGLAGRLLHDALEAAGIHRAQVHVTNVVKHFKWEPRGKRRIQKPNAREIAACRPSLNAEIEVPKPDEHTRRIERRRPVIDLKQVARVISD